MSAREPILVTGAGGFIGGHLVASLLADGAEVRAVDLKPTPEWEQVHGGAENLELDLRLRESAFAAVRGASRVFNLACDMGGVAFLERNRAACMLSVLINTHLLEAAREEGVERYLFASSACVYPAGRQDAADAPPLAEADAYPAMPEDGYGWEKLFGERLCRHFTEDFGLGTRVARFHNVYGPNGAFEGGREKAPAAICRKVAEAELTGDHRIEVWGDGEQTRSFTYIDDCIHGTKLLMESEVAQPVNIGSSQLVSINELVGAVERIAGIELRREHDLSAPQGVRGRNSDNSLVRELLGWEPGTSLADGLEPTYRWIRERVASRQPA